MSYYYQPCHIVINLVADATADDAVHSLQMKQGHSAVMQDTHQRSAMNKRGQTVLECIPQPCAFNQHGLSASWGGAHRLHNVRF